MKEIHGNLSMKGRIFLYVLLPLSAFALGFASYFVFTRSSVLDIPNVDGLQLSTGTRAVNNGNNRDDIAFRSLVDLLDNSRFDSHFRRSVALYGIVSRADTNELQTLFKQSNHITAYHLRMQAQNLILQRLTEHNPNDALALLNEGLATEERNRFFASVFGAWSHINLSDAIEQARDLNMETRDAVIERMVLSRDDLSPRQRRDIAKQLGREWIAINALIDTGVLRVFDDTPEREWNQYLEDNQEGFSNLSEPQVQALGHILLAWVEQGDLDMVTALSTSLPPSFSIFETMKFVTDRLLNNKPQLALDLTLEMSYYFEHHHRLRYLSNVVIKQWAEVEPGPALAATLSVTDRSLRNSLQTNVVIEWAKKDPKALLDAASTLSKHLQLLARQTAMVEISKTEPKRVVNMLGDFSIRKSRDIVAYAIARNLVTQAGVSKTLRWIDYDSNVSHIREELKRHVFTQLARTDPRKGVSEAVKLPVENHGLGWEATIVSRLVSDGDIDTAVELLPKVRSGRTRTEAYGDVISHLISEQYDLNVAVDLFLQLGPPDSNNLMYVVDDLTRLAPEHLYNGLDEIQSEETRLYVASSLYSNNHRKSTLTSDELKLLESMLNR